jgi:hypothetical protein
VDFVALGQAVVGFTSFLVNNAQTILRVVAALFVLNTTFKLMSVILAASQVAIQLKTWYLAQMTAGMTKATLATNLFSGALRLIPFVAVLSGLALLATALVDNKDKFEAYKDQIGLTNDALDANGDKLSGLQIALKPIGDLMSELTFGVIEFERALRGLPSLVETTVRVNYETGSNVFRDSRSPGYSFSSGGGGVSAPAIPGLSGGGGGGTSRAPSLSEQLKKEGKIATKEAKLVSKGLSEGLASRITGSATPIKEANKVLQRIAKNGQKAVNNLQAQFNKTKAGRAEIANLNAQASAAAEQAAAQSAMIAQQQAADQQRIADELARAQQEEADREAAILAERERVYNSFLDSVKNTFANIRNSIMGAFDITQLGGSTNSITRNMEKLLTRLRSFATNVKNLSGMGLDPALLQQVIAAGPLAGARLAQTLVAGGANALASINAGFNEFGVLSSQIATTGTESRFGTAAQQSVYNISVDGGVGSGATIGKAIVDAIKAYERTSGAVWQGA